MPLSHASSAASRPPSQGWGPGWLAMPSLYDSFIRYSLPVYPGAIQGCRPVPAGQFEEFPEGRWASWPRRNQLTLKATEVFVPGSYPQHTYVERSAQGLEDSLRDALATPGQVISLSGPSKSGKTVLIERVVGRDLLIPISGASLRSPDDVWNRVLDWMDLPDSTAANQKIAATLGGSV